MREFGVTFLLHQAKLIWPKGYLVLLLICVLSEYSAPENVANLATPAKKLEHVIRLAELVIEVLQQNQDHHAEVSKAGIPVFYTAYLL